MDTQAHRKLRLRELIDHSCGGYISVMAAKIGKADTYVSRMLYPAEKPGAKPVGDKMMLTIEAAFGLERAWLDKPAGYGLSDGSQAVDSPRDAHGALWVADEKTQPQGRTEMTWPFKIVSYQRVLALHRLLGPKRNQEALRDIDKHLEIVMLKWEREAELAVKSRAA